MTTPATTRRLLARRADVFARAERKLAEQRAARDEAVRGAYEAGVGATEIASLTGLSRPYVYMLVNKEPAVHRPGVSTDLT
jgi:hypothetical protein